MADVDAASDGARSAGQHSDVVPAALSPAIPATPDEDTGVFYPGTAAPHGRADVSTRDYPSFLDASLPQPFPLSPSAPQPLASPPAREPHIDLSFAGTFLPTDLSLPTPTLTRIPHNLRLPSFDVLGIAAPHPDRVSLSSTHPFSPFGAGPLSKPEDPLHALSPPLGLERRAGQPTKSLISSPRATRNSFSHRIPTFTPPEEPGTFSWGSPVNVTHAGLGSPPSSDPGVSPNLTLTASLTSPAQAPIIVPTYTEIDDAVRMAAWVEHVKDTITTESGCRETTSVKVLSHALPCPSLTGHLFSQVIAAIHNGTGSNTLWINVFHAVPGRFTLSDLPKSPPSTPGPAVGGDEFFTTKVFDSAVAIPDYQLDSKLLPPSPRPVVPPGSIDISVVERYIPATNTNEYAEMFAFKGRSLLHDRLDELSSNNGTLLFIYPTKTGGRTFMKEYLGPIIDPLLRTITVVHDLSSDLGKNLGYMDAVNYLDEFEQLEKSVGMFCEALNNGKGGGGPRSNSDGKSKYEVVHASREEATLLRSVWAEDWWIKQEKPRVREVVSKYFRKAKKVLTDGEMTSAHLIQEVLDGVASRDYVGSGPKRGVEVGVFVIKKSRST